MASVGEASTCLTLLPALLMSSVADCSALSRPLLPLLSAAGASGSADRQRMRWCLLGQLGKRAGTREGRGGRRRAAGPPRRPCNDVHAAAVASSALTPGDRSP